VVGWLVVVVVDNIVRLVAHGRDIIADPRNVDNMVVIVGPRRALGQHDRLASQDREPPMWTPEHLRELCDQAERNIHHTHATLQRSYELIAMAREAILAAQEQRRHHAKSELGPSPPSPQWSSTMTDDGASEDTTIG